jgi:hypothetical protein
MWLVEKQIYSLHFCMGPPRNSGSIPRPLGVASYPKAMVILLTTAFDDHHSFSTPLRISSVYSLMAAVFSMIAFNILISKSLLSPTSFPCLASTNWKKMLDIPGTILACLRNFCGGCDGVSVVSTSESKLYSMLGTWRSRWKHASGLPNTLSSDYLERGMRCSVEVETSEILTFWLKSTGSRGAL